MDEETCQEYELLIRKLREQHATREADEAAFLLTLLAQPKRFEEKDTLISTLRETYGDEKLARILRASSTRKAIETAVTLRLKELVAQAKQASLQAVRGKRTDSPGEEPSIQHVIQREAQRARQQLPRDVLLHELHPMEAFWPREGVQIRTLPELIDYLRREPPGPDEWPVLRSRIVQWLEEAFHAHDLAERIVTARTPEDARHMLEEEVISLIEDAVQRTRKRYEHLKSLHALLSEAEEKQGEARRKKEKARKSSESLTPPLASLPSASSSQPTLSSSQSPQSPSPSFSQPRAASVGKLRDESSASHPPPTSIAHTPSTPTAATPSSPPLLPPSSSTETHHPSTSHDEYPLPIPIPGVNEDQPSHPEHGEEGKEHESAHPRHADPFAESLTLPALPARLRELARQEAQHAEETPEKEAPIVMVDEHLLEKILHREGKKAERAEEEGKEDRAEKEAQRHDEARVEETIRTRHEPSQTYPPMREEVSHGLFLSEEPIQPALAQHLLRELEEREKALRELEAEIEEKLYRLLHEKEAREAYAQDETSPTLTPPLVPEGPSMPSPPISSSPLASPSPSSSQASHPIHEDTPPSVEDTPLSTSHTPSSPLLPSDEPRTTPLAQTRTDDTASTARQEVGLLESLIRKPTIPADARSELTRIFHELAEDVSRQDFTKAVRLVRRAKRLVKKLARETRDDQLRLLLYELETLEIDMKLSMLGEAA